MIVAFIGKPGSGKDTISRELSRRKGYPLVVTGDLLREEAKKDSELGKYIRERINRGEIVDDSIVAEIVARELEKYRDKKVVLLNGYPRTPNQIKELEKRGFKIDLAIELDVPDDIVVERLCLRRMCPKCGRIYNLKYNPPKEDELCDCCKVKLVQREDDKEDVVRYRLKRFYDEIEGIRKHFESAGRLVKIDANRSIEEIVRDVEKCLS